jgi:hydrogenase expression/formation protein HypC
LSAADSAAPTQGSCLTCGDTAVAVTVLELLDDALARVDAGGGRRETVSVAFVRAGVGDTVLVHAGEAIATLPPSPTGRGQELMDR